MPRKTSKSQPNFENDSEEGTEGNPFKLPEQEEGSTQRPFELPSEEPIEKSLKKIESEEIKNPQKIKKLKSELDVTYGGRYSLESDFGTKIQNYDSDLAKLRDIISMGAISPSEVLDVDSPEA